MRAGLSSSYTPLMRAVVRIIIEETAVVELPPEALNYADSLEEWVRDRMEFSWGPLEVLHTTTELWEAEVIPAFERGEGEFLPLPPLDN